jgi:hypothetical protein
LVYGTTNDLHPMVFEKKLSFEKHGDIFCKVCNKNIKFEIYQIRKKKKKLPIIELYELFQAKIFFKKHDLQAGVVCMFHYNQFKNNVVIDKTKIQVQNQLQSTKIENEYFYLLKQCEMLVQRINEYENDIKSLKNKLYELNEIVNSFENKNSTSVELKHSNKYSNDIYDLMADLVTQYNVSARQAGMIYKRCLDTQISGNLIVSEVPSFQTTLRAVCTKKKCIRCVNCKENFIITKSVLIH